MNLRTPNYKKCVLLMLMPVVLVMMLLVMLWLVRSRGLTDFGKGLLDSWHIRFVGIIGDGHGLFFHVENKVLHTVLQFLIKRNVF